MVKSVFITGSTGYLAHFLINSFLAKGFNCYIYRRDKSPLPFNNPNLFSIYSLDPSFFQVHQISIDAVLHIGSPSASQATGPAIEECLMQAQQIGHVVSQLKIPTLIFFSSIHVYGEDYTIFTEDMPLNPISAYGSLKCKLESYFTELSLSSSFAFVSLRLSNVIGPPYIGFRNWHLVFHSFLRSCVLDHSLSLIHI